MKKFYLLILVSLGSLALYSQPFSIITPPGGAPGLLTAPGIDVTGDTVVYCDANSDSTVIIQGKLYVVNETGATINTVVQRFEECLVAGSENYFCWDICWSSAVNVSGPMSITAGDTVNYFYGDYKPKTNEGASVVRYRFYDDANSSSYNEVYIKFNAGSCAAIADCYIGIDEEEVAITSVYPNPATDLITFEYNTNENGGQIVISDLTGKIVRTMPIGAGATKSTLSLDGFNNGIYFYSFYVNSKQISTHKFIVNK